MLVVSLISVSTFHIPWVRTRPCWLGCLNVEILKHTPVLFKKNLSTLCYDALKCSFLLGVLVYVSVHLRLEKIFSPRHVFVSLLDIYSHLSPARSATLYWCSSRKTVGDWSIPRWTVVGTTEPDLHWKGTALRATQWSRGHSWMSCWITSHVLGVRSALKRAEDLNGYMDRAGPKWSIVRQQQLPPKERHNKKGHFCALATQLSSAH